MPAVTAVRVLPTHAVIYLDTDGRFHLEQGYSSAETATAADQLAKSGLPGLILSREDLITEAGGHPLPFYAPQALRQEIAFRRSLGQSWALIGRALGISRQAAWERFTRLTGDDS